MTIVDYIYYLMGVSVIKGSEFSVAYFFKDDS